MLTISKVLVILCLLCLCGNRECPGSFQNKSESASFQMCDQVYSVLGLTEGGR